MLVKNMQTPDHRGVAVSGRSLLRGCMRVYIVWWWRMNVEIQTRASEIVFRRTPESGRRLKRFAPKRIVGSFRC